MISPRAAIMIKLPSRKPLEEIMTACQDTDVVELAKQFIDIDSITGNEYNMAMALYSWLKPRGFTVKFQCVDVSEKNDDELIDPQNAPQKQRYNVLAYPTNTDPRNAKIIINSHIDTVPPYLGAAVQRKNKLYGRGAVDTKSIIAAQLIAAQTLLRQHALRSMALLYTVGEEVDSIGMRRANHLQLNAAKFMITGEPTESRTISGQKGCYKFDLESVGTAAHFAYPEKGQCALTPLLNIVHAIQNEQWPKDALFGETTVNVWITAGGNAANVIADRAAAEVLFRVSGDPRYLQNRVRELIRRFDAHNQIRYKEECAYRPVRLESVDEEKYRPYLVSYTTDIPLCRNVMDGRCKAVLFGPGSITVAHSKDEHIDIDELKRSVQTYQDIVLNLFKRCTLSKM